MNIAVATDGKNLDSQVSEKFEKCLYLLIVNMNDLSVTVIENPSEQNLANEVLKYNCEALITGNMELMAFNILADAYITRFLGVGYSAEKALELMDKGVLQLIKNHAEEEGCSGHHHH